MRIGLDFDNTLVCYDDAFFQLARENESVPADLPRVKEEVKAFLQARGRNDFWTELQGLAYGPRMDVATLFPGVNAFIEQAARVGVELFIVSHRSPRPYSGLDYDLHAAARAWLNKQDWVSAGLIKKENIFFEAEKKGKIQKISDLRLDYFVDDLAEILNDPLFPAHTKKVHFQPNLVTAEFREWPKILRHFQELWTTEKSKA